MHITLEADYAVRIVNCLAKHGQRLDAKAVSEQTGVTLRFSLKILRKLVAGGLVRSYKGAHGGYELLKPPETMTLYDVIQTVEGPYVLSRCLSPEFSCNRNCKEDAHCRFSNIYREVSEMVVDRLSKVTFAQK